MKISMFFQRETKTFYWIRLRKKNLWNKWAGKESIIFWILVLIYNFSFEFKRIFLGLNFMLATKIKETHEEIFHGNETKKMSWIKSNDYGAAYKFMNLSLLSLLLCILRNLQHLWIFLGVTILLSLTVFLNLVAETLPQVSDAIPLLGREISTKSCHVQDNNLFYYHNILSLFFVIVISHVGIFVNCSFSLFS